MVFWRANIIVYTCKLTYIKVWFDLIWLQFAAMTMWHSSQADADVCVIQVQQVRAERQVVMVATDSRASSVILDTPDRPGLRAPPVRSSLYRWCTVVSGHWNNYDEPEVENVAQGRSPSATFSTEGHHISMSHERPCFICFVVWPTTSLKLYIVFWDGSETRVSVVRHLKMHTYLITVRG